MKTPAMVDRCVELLKALAKGFSCDKFQDFLERKMQDSSLYRRTLYLSYFNFKDDRFEDAFHELAKSKVQASSLIKAYAIKVNTELTERTSKKKQFECAKKILNSDKEYPDAGFFAFYDENGNFRLSFIYKIYRPGRVELSHYKRFTYYVEKNKPYRTFLKQLSETPFDSLKNIVLAFSVQPLTKDFYTEIQNWFAWAKERIWFPGGSREENLIRLLTQLLFVWFLKERKLIPEELFDPSFLRDVVKDFGKGNYYFNVILQNLFFATLNTYQNDRGWATDDGFPANRENFGVKTLFRYEKFLKISKDEFIKIFREIPFINGGLFECLDDDKNYVDGFTRNENKRAKLPDDLFFGDEREVDLSDFYGEKKKARVRGLINILKDYNFTADENSPVDVEVSLDPELLGHIFENLLAAYNPETQTTARKATGSYYTPKEIVEFMVDSALLEHFKNKTSIAEDKLASLLSYEEKEIDLSDEEKEKLVKAIDELKVIDPAVGSGAFPMGILHKLVHILNKIDPDNERWQELQFQKAIDSAIKLEKTYIDEERKKEIRREIYKDFDEKINYPDYARKLYLIENSLYGVDIQPIAIQICKLRFFLSLIIDQKIDRSKENLGIRPLPHLETKFVTANTLIGLPKPEQLKFTGSEYEELKERLKELYKKHFAIKNREEKKRLQEEAEKVKEEMRKVLEEYGWPADTIEKLLEFNIFDQRAKADWFDAEWMFGIDNGFDIVIANPPYVRQERIKKDKPVLQKQDYQVFDPVADLYVYFYEKGYELLRPGGIFCFISSNKWMRARYGTKLRRFLKENTKVLQIVDFAGYPVFEQTVDTNIILFKKEKPDENHLLKFYNVNRRDGEISEVIEEINDKFGYLSQKKLTENAWTLADEKVIALKEKIERLGKPLKDWDIGIYFGIKTGFNEAFIIDTKTREEILANCLTDEERKRTEEIIKPVLRGRDIFRYGYRWAGLWLIKIESGWTNKNRKGKPPDRFFKETFPALYQHLFSYAKRQSRGKGLLGRDDQGDYWWELRDCDYYSEFEKEKIVWQEIVTVPSFAYDRTGIYCEATSFLMTGQNLKYLLGILNSQPAAFFFKTFYAGGWLGQRGFRYKKAFLEQLPIPPLTPQNRAIAEKIEWLVEQILALTQSNDYLENQEKQAKVKFYEQQIDELVYKLYNLNEEEIKIVEGYVTPRL